MQKDQKPYNILIIEDNPSDLFLFEIFLEKQISSPKLFKAETFKEAKEILISQYDEIQVVFLDLSLPDKSGEDLIRNILNFTKDLPVIVLTGRSDVDFSIRSLEMGISDYLLKDELNPTTLYKSIIYNLERKRILNNLKESEKRYSELFHLSPSPKWVYETNTFFFLNVNKAAIDHYGYSYSEFLTMKRQDILAEPRSFRENKSKLHEVHTKKSGERITVDIHSNKVIFKGIEAKVEVINDVTEQIRYISAIEEQNKKLKIISWHQSHMVRAPLARMMGLIEILTDKFVSEPEKQELLHHLLSSAEEFDQIIKEIVVHAELVDSTANVNNNEEEIPESRS